MCTCTGLGFCTHLNDTKFLSWRDTTLVQCETELLLSLNTRLDLDGGWEVLHHETVCTDLNLLHLLRSDVGVVSDV